MSRMPEMMNADAPTAPPDAWTMDGMPHDRDAKRCHCTRGLTGSCSKCGGLLHAQGGWGFWFKLCQDCGHTP